MVLKRCIIPFLILFVTSCSEPNTDNPTTVSVGETIFNDGCAACHGLDGKLGAGGASDLSLSTLSEEDAELVITEGRGGMPTQQHLFTNDSEIEEVVEYVMSLKK